MKRKLIFLESLYIRKKMRDLNRFQRKVRKHPKPIQRFQAVNAKSSRRKCNCSSSARATLHSRQYKHRFDELLFDEGNPMLLLFFVGCLSCLFCRIGHPKVRRRCLFDFKNTRSCTLFPGESSSYQEGAESLPSRAPVKPEDFLPQKWTVCYALRPRIRSATDS